MNYTTTRRSLVWNSDAGRWAGVSANVVSFIVLLIRIIDNTFVFASRSAIVPVALMYLKVKWKLSSLSSLEVLLRQNIRRSYYIRILCLAVIYQLNFQNLFQQVWFYSKYCVKLLMCNTITKPAFTALQRVFYLIFLFHCQCHIFSIIVVCSSFCLTPQFSG